MWVKGAGESAQRASSGRRELRRWLKAGLFVGALTAAFLLGAYLHDEGFLHSGRQILESNVRIPVNWLGSRLATSESLSIDINFENFQELAENRRVALERGGLLPDARNEVPATASWNGERTPIRIRLKGDLPDHWKHPWRWSFRIQTRGDRTILGMKQFSVQHPRTRGFINDWLFHRFLKFNGLIGLRYEFIDLTVNGRHFGVTALEESYDKRLVEDNRRRNGPLLRVDTDFLWYHRPGIADSFFSTVLKPYQSSQISEDPLLSDQYESARRLFEGVREGAVAAADVFDVQKFARFFAILDLMGNYHAAALDNLVFYLNPITNKLEPVSGDNQRIASNPTLMGAQVSFESDTANGYRYWFQRLFVSPEFYRVYVRELDRISRPELLDDFLHQYQDEMLAALRVLHRDFPWYDSGPVIELLYQNQKGIRGFLTPVRTVQAYWHQPEEGEGEAMLEVASIHQLPVEIIGVKIGESKAMVSESPMILDGQDPRGPLEFHRVGIQSDSSGASGRLEESVVLVETRILGGNEVQANSVQEGFSRDLSDLRDADLRQEANHQRFGFLEIDEQEKLIVFVAGDWILDEDLVLPGGYTILAGEGVRLDLTNGARIISRSPLKFMGSADAPIVIDSTDRSGQGVVVLEVSERSTLQNVHFMNLAYPKGSGWELTGAVTFFESPVDVIRSRFVSNRSEDALNLIRSEFRIEQTVFEKSHSDALDIDFGSGQIIDSSFLDCRNDGLDVSGSRVWVERLVVRGAGDKGLSAGERSHLTGRDVLLEDAEVALAAKDMSTVAISGLEIIGGRVGLTAFQKKSEFGPAHIVVAQLELVGVEVPFLIENGSSATVDGEAITDLRDDVSSLMYGEEYGRASN